MKKLFLTLNFLAVVLMLSMILHASGNPTYRTCVNCSAAPEKKQLNKEEIPSRFDGLTPHILLF